MKKTVTGILLASYMTLTAQMSIAATRCPDPEQIKPILLAMIQHGDIAFSENSEHNFNAWSATPVNANHHNWSFLADLHSLKITDSTSAQKYLTQRITRMHRVTLTTQTDLYLCDYDAFFQPETQHNWLQLQYSTSNH